MPAPRKSKSKQLGAADAVDQQLAKYRGMRDFSITGEPAGKSRIAAAKSVDAGLPFVIQKHAATRLHYDFRLGWTGVLKSWAVTKGPSYFTGDKRLAVQVEDHPMEYGGFEGIIPAGQYGGGTVMLWDHGTWEPQPGHTDVDEGLRSGSLKFTLNGTKMKGNWALIRMGGKAAGESKPNWLLIKEHDGLERPESDPPVTEAEPNSVLTGRSLEEIAASEDHVWNSRESAQGRDWYRNDGPPATPKKTASTKTSASKIAASKTAASKTAASKTAATKAAARDNAASPSPPRSTPREALPKFIQPQLATHAAKPASSAGWVHELKLDGYRIQARKDGEQVQLLTRSGLDWTHRMKSIADAVKALPAETALLDGEVVVLSPDGTTSFADLQAAFQEGVRKPLTYFAFDLLHLNGHNLRGLPLLERKALLSALIETAGEWIRLSEHLDTDGSEMFRKACELHVEGIVSKRAASPYTAGRSADWLKLKCIREQEFVIGGFTLPTNGTHGIGALLLGYQEGGKLVYAGRTGTGFTAKTHKVMRDQLDALRQTSCPFDKLPAATKRGAIWVKPTLVAQVRFATWTADKLVRQASFKGLREDKQASEVRREEPEALQQGTSPEHAAAKPAKHASHTAAATVAAKARTARPEAGAEPKSAAKSNAKGSQHAPIRLTHPEKVLDAESGVTKQMLADYYWAVAEFMLPHVAGRPLSLVRCPEGTASACFYQKHANHMLPPGIEAVDVPDKKTGKLDPYITLSTPEALAGLGQMGVLEVHPWGSRSQDLEHPDRIIIDLDPDATISWKTLAESALEVRGAFKELKLESFLKSTGGKGLHVVVPVEPRHDWAAIKQFAHDLAVLLEKQNPSLYLTKMSKAARKDRIFIDYLRNERGATAVAPFSPRARPGVGVSLPLSWTDLKLPERPVFRVADFAAWKSRLRRNPWKDMVESKQRLGG